MEYVSYFGEQFGSALAVAFLGYAITLSLAKVFAFKHNYEVDPMQEAFALGFANALGSVFHTIPGTTSLSRTALQVTI